MKKGKKNYAKDSTPRRMTGLPMSLFREYVELLKKDNIISE